MRTAFHKPKSCLKKSVLIADALHTFRFHYSLPLREEGFQVQFAANILELWERLSQEEFQAIILDPFLQDDCEKMLADIATHHPKAKIILFSWQISEGLKNIAKKFGIQEIQKKGAISPEAMTERIEQLLGSELNFNRF